jgi:hypothetical protein
MVRSEDLPDPDGPSRTTKSFIEHETDLAQGVNLDLAHAIDLRELTDIEDRGAHVETHRNRSASSMPWVSDLIAHSQTP